MIYSAADAALGYRSVHIERKLGRMFMSFADTIVGFHWFDLIPILIMVGIFVLIVWLIPRWVISFLRGVRQGLREDAD